MIFRSLSLINSYAVVSEAFVVIMMSAVIRTQVVGLGSLLVNRGSDHLKEVSWFEDICVINKSTFGAPLVGF